MLLITHSKCMNAIIFEADAWSLDVVVSDKDEIIGMIDEALGEDIRCFKFTDEYPVTEEASYVLNYKNACEEDYVFGQLDVEDIICLYTDVETEDEGIITIWHMIAVRMKKYM